MGRPDLRHNAGVTSEPTEFGEQERRLLQERAGRLYREVVEAGSLPSADKRFRANASDRPAYDLLVDLGLLTLEDDHVVAVDPSLVQSRVVAPLGQRASELMEESTQWANTFAELGQVFRRTRPTDVAVTEVRGLPNINRYISSIVADAEHELLTAQPAGARPAETLKVAMARDVRALERGLSMRTLYQHSARRSIATRDYVTEVTRHGAQVRTLDEFFERLIVVDRRVAIIPAADDEDVAVVVHDANLIAYLADVFERYWERAHSFIDREDETQRAVADDVHNMTVRMLLEGHSDDASAKRMGVSTRTYAGYVAALKHEYGVQTRFQLGHAMASPGTRERRGRSGEGARSPE